MSIVKYLMSFRFLSRCTCDIFDKFHGIIASSSLCISLWKLSSLIKIAFIVLEQEITYEFVIMSLVLKYNILLRLELLSLLINKIWN